MIQAREIVPVSLEHALLASRVLVALNEPARNSIARREALEEGALFLRSILSGPTVAKNREVSNVSYRSTLAFGQAIKALEQLPAPTTGAREITPIVKDLLKSLQKLRAGKRVPDASIRRLSSFFRTVRDVTLRSDVRKVENMTVIG